MNTRPGPRFHMNFGPGPKEKHTKIRPGPRFHMNFGPGPKGPGPRGLERSPYVGVCVDGDGDGCGAHDGGGDRDGDGNGDDGDRKASRESTWE